jgi:undecaprenyl-diphosphatase
MSQLSYLEAIVMGAVQGISELFPISSLGHSIIIPALVGGQWAKDLSVSAPESPYLAFIVGLHVATAFALLLYFWKDWLRIIRGFGSSIRHRRIQTAPERLAWMLIVATIPVGIIGLALDHVFRTVLGTPAPAAIFLIINGGILALGEYLRRRAVARDYVGRRRRTHLAPEPTRADEEALGTDAVLGRLPFRRAVLVGASQAFALLPGISRSGTAMVSGLAIGLSHREAARFSAIYSVLAGTVSLVWLGVQGV